MGKELSQEGWIKLYNEAQETIKLKEEEIERYKLSEKIRYTKGLEKEQQKTKGKYFIKRYRERGMKVTESHLLTQAEKAFLYDMEPYVAYLTNILADRRGVPLSQKKICSLTGFTRAYVSRIIKSLKEKDMISEIKEERSKYYILNKENVEFGKSKDYEVE